MSPLKTAQHERCQPQNPTVEEPARQFQEAVVCIGSDAPSTTSEYPGRAFSSSSSWLSFCLTPEGSGRTLNSSSSRPASSSDCPGHGANLRGRRDGRVWSALSEAQGVGAF